MLPSAFVTLKALPLTPNGKVDRQALPPPDQARPGFGGCVPPRDALEEQLAAIWGDLLGVELVGVHDNFFELGGHSLLAARMVDKVQKTLRKPVPLATLFRAPTIAEFAKQIESDKPNGFNLLEPIRVTGNGAVVLYVGGRFHDNMLVVVPSSHPIYWCKPEHVDGKRMRYFAIDDLADHYCRQISAAGLKGPYVLCGYSFGALVAFGTAQVLRKRTGAPVLVFLLEPSIGMNTPYEGFSARIAGDRWNFRRAGGKERLQFLRRKVLSLFHRIKMRVKSLYCSARLAVGLDVPGDLRYWYVEDDYRRMVRRYVPGPFFGKIVLVHGRAYPEDATAQWTKLAKGGIRIHAIAAQSHQDLVSDPRLISRWVEIFQQYLEQPFESGLLAEEKTAEVS